jgi:hypothetical protein
MQVIHIGCMLGAMHGGNIGSMHGAVLEYTEIATRIGLRYLAQMYLSGTITAWMQSL